MYDSGAIMTPDSAVPKILGYDDMDDDNEGDGDDDDDLGEFQVQDEEFGAASKKGGSRKAGSKSGKGRSSKADDNDNDDENNEDGGIGGALAAFGGLGALGIPGLGGSGGGSGKTAGSGSSKHDKKETERQRLLMQAFDDSQMARYEAFRRANVSKGSVKKLANAVLGQSIPAPVATALCGLSKVFIGELVESARRVQHNQNRKAYYELKPIMDKQLEKEKEKYNASKGIANTNKTNDLSQSHITKSSNGNLSAELSISSFPFLDNSLNSSGDGGDFGGLGLNDLVGLGVGNSLSNSTIGNGSFNIDALSGSGLLGAASLKEQAQALKNSSNPLNLVYPPTDDEEAEKAIELLDRQPLKPEHLREAWRLYKLESGTVPAAQWRRQGGDGDGKMFR